MRAREATEVVCLGETMAVLVPHDPEPLERQQVLRLEVGGAESNVACGLAALGHRVAWVSRVGDDPLGRRVLADLRDRGVDVRGVETDPDRPTGVYFKDTGPAGTGTYYYRRGSAATRMGPALAHTCRAPLLHLSGITAALSDSCAELVAEIVVRRAVPGATVSFDVNHRPALWRHRDPATALLEPARRADIVFVGRDEAETLWGTAGPKEIRDLLAPAPVIVVKDAEHGATAYTADGGEVFVAAPHSRIVERVGAGDAFAAGYLAAHLEGRGVAAALRLGHLMAAAALATGGDVPTAPDRAELDRLLGLDDEEWQALRLG
ncbi:MULTISPECIES: sugar kinase [unclassified Streptomyces]|uniref:sugar kinase n=1 Tax=unclassified Streptomyces TaxID=2593676 RepID=UPI002475CFF1|nr:MULTISPECIES: sugar kinase [unclassified Streptomyces]MDH6456373.1 2-dehydro-3-deoxygluconokinase [Streptomyces sp. SAI-119]MDH6501698.1 2-dehydro-3-deoxygluconokinase [Streptomyces sp. SAI-149]